MYYFRKMHLWGSKSHAVYSIPLCFYLEWSAHLGTMSNFRVWPYYNGYMTGWGGFLGGGLGVVPAIIYHCNAVLVEYV